MSASQIHDMLQRQIVAEGGCGEGYGLQGGYSDMGEYGGARRRAKKAFPEDAKAGLCAYRLFQAQHKGLTREEMSAKWARHKAKKGSGLTAGRLSGGCAYCGGEGGCICGSAMSGGAGEFGADVDGLCVYRNFAAEHKGVGRKVLNEGWRGAKKGYFERHPGEIGPSGGYGSESDDMEGGFLGQQKVFQKIRNFHPKATRAELSRFFENARKAFYKKHGKKAPRRRRTKASGRTRDLGGKPLEELIMQCVRHAQKSGVVPEALVTKVLAHPSLTKSHAKVVKDLSKGLAQPGVIAALDEVAESIKEEMKHEGKPPKLIPLGAPPGMAKAAVKHAATTLQQSPAGKSNAAAAAEIIKAAKSAAIEEPSCDPNSDSATPIAQLICQRAHARYAAQHPPPVGNPASALAAAVAEAGGPDALLAELGEPVYGLEDVYEEGAGLMGGRRMTAAQKRAFIRKCMRS